MHDAHKAMATQPVDIEQNSNSLTDFQDPPKDISFLLSLPLSLAPFCLFQSCQMTWKPRVRACYTSIYLLGHFHPLECFPLHICISKPV